jgi:hypothetical protein
MIAEEVRSGANRQQYLEQGMKHEKDRHLKAKA